MNLLPISTGTSSYTEIDGHGQRRELQSTGSLVSTTYVVSPGKYIDLIIDNDNLFVPTELFKIEKEYFKELIKNKEFLKKNKGKYIGIKKLEILKIDDNFSHLAEEIYKNKDNLGKVLIRKIAEKEEVIHLDSPIY